MLSMNYNHTLDEAKYNFVKSSFVLMITLFLWTCVQIITRTFNMKPFSWVLSITGFIFSITVFCYFGIDRQSDWFRFDGIYTAGACAIAMFSMLPLIIVYGTNLKGGLVEAKANNENVSDSQTKETLEETSEETSTVDDDNWEPATVDDLHSGEYELES